jgi:hypothetical protein
METKLRTRKDFNKTREDFCLCGTNKAYLQFHEQYDTYKQRFYTKRLSVGRTMEQVWEEFRDAMRRHDRRYIFSDLLESE